jgi:nitrite reductase/ring-hydroxylating ferredoxin subunit
VDELWILVVEVAQMARLLARLVALNDGWAQPFGDFNHRWLSALFRPMPPIRDLLNGRWLGHPLHAAITDIPIGLLLGVVVLDVLDQPSAADIALVGTVLFMLAAAVSGSADYSDTDGTARTRATLHATLMVVALLLLLVSMAMRSGAPADRTIPIGLGVVAFVIVSAGAFVGGDVVYLLGNMVSRHAFRGPGTKWIRLDLGAVGDLASLPDATPTKVKAGINDLVLARIGDTVHAMHAVCAHAGGPLDKGTVVDGCLQCPWHASRFRLADGHVVRGPALYDQPSYEIRVAEGGGYEVRRSAS